MKYFRTYFLFLIIGLIQIEISHANTFSGHVFDENTRFPIIGATITVGNAGWPPDSTIYTANSDVEGFYSIAGLPDAEDYTVLASAIGYESKELLMKSPPETIDFYLKKPLLGFLVETINRGLKLYHCDNGYCYRDGGTVDDSFFPNVDAQSDTINNLLTAIGAGVNQTSEDSEIWGKCSIVWNWLKANAYFDTNDPDWQNASAFLNSEGWPSIQRIAETYMTFGFIPWGTCMSRAHILTTLLYRVGVPKDRVAIAETNWALRYSQHMYTIVNIAKRWLYIDPSVIDAIFPSFDQFSSVPINGPPYGPPYADYAHPLEIKIIQGSNLSSVPEITKRAINSKNILITSPPNKTHTPFYSIHITGVSENIDISEVKINNISYPIISGEFEANIPVSSGTNNIIAEVNFNNNTFSDSVTVIKDFATLPMHIVDFDGDGKTDIGVYHSASGLWFIKKSSDGAEYDIGYGGPEYKPVPGDYDGDGKTDIAAYHSASGLWFIKKSSDGTDYYVGYGGTGYVPVPGDYDGDGKTDIAVYHSASGLWFMKPSTGAADYYVGYGGSGYVPVPGDYDGDRKTDIAVYHSVSGLWFVNPSSGEADYSVGYGGSGYVPVPGDYDGDIKTDIAVCHSASGLWFIKPSSGAADYSVGYGGSGYTPVNMDYLHGYVY